MIEKIVSFFRREMGKQSSANIADIISESAKWRPSPGNSTYTFEDEMNNRLSYYHASMFDDMTDVIKRNFPLTHKEIQNEQLNLPLLRAEIDARAKVFCGTGDLYLADENGERVEGQDADNFSRLVEDARVWPCLKQADVYTQLLTRCMVKPWWDTSCEHVRISIWPQQQAFIAPNPNRWWDVDAANAVLLQMPGVDGVNSTEYRYEVWGYRDIEAVDATGKDTVHFITSGDGSDVQVNADDVNPFTDPLTGRPIYPFVWWRVDDTLDLYALGDEDSLTTNRWVNMGLTHLGYSIKMKAYGIWAHVMAENGKELGVKTISPSSVVDMPYGSTLQHLSTNLPISETWEVYKDVIATNALLRGLPSNAVRAESGSPDSGYALKIKSKALTEHRENLVGVYQPQVVDTLRRTIIVHNTYAPQDKQIDPSLTVVWVPGELDFGNDATQIGEIYSAEVAANVSTAADWRAERYGEDKAKAEEAVKANMEFNTSLTKQPEEREPVAGLADRLANMTKQKAEEPAIMSQFDKTETEDVEE